MTAPTRLVFVDVETTGLDPWRHDIWELGLVSTSADGDGNRWETAWQFPLPPRRDADPYALEVGRYYERRKDDDQLADPLAVAGTLRAVLDGAVLAGASVDFDARFIERFLARYMPAISNRPWHHRLLDVEAYAAGVLCWPLPRSLSDTCRGLGIERTDAHTALGDALIAEGVYRAASELRHPVHYSF